jgi:glycosyltransferase involved in cell wall biosynthesis
MPLRILMLSLSRDLAETPAPVLNEAQLRQCRYAEFCDSVDILVKAGAARSKVLQIAPNARVHPTGTLNNVRTAWTMWALGNRLIRSGGVNLVVAQEPFLTGLVGTWLARRWGLPLALHYVCDFFDNEEWLRERVSHRWWNSVGKWVVRRAAVVRIDSEDQRERLAAIGVAPDAIHYVPFLQLGLERFSEHRGDPALRHELLRDGESIVLTVARLEPQKDLDTLLSVAEEVTRVRPGARFVIIGDGPERPRAEQLIRSRGLSGVVQLRGWIDFFRLPAYFAVADLFLLTSRYETSARVLVLARAAGVPIVSTAVSGAEALASGASGSAVVNVGDVSTLAACVIHRLQNRGKHRMLAESMRAEITPIYGESPAIEQMRQFCVAAFASPVRQHLPKLVYVLPKFDSGTGEHFFHTYGLLESLARRTELAVIVEKAVGRAAFGSARVYTQRWASIAPLRFLEALWLSFRLRAKGFRTFYVHYSYFGAIAASVTTRMFGGRVFYWHCVSTFFKKRGWSAGAVTHWLKAELPLALTIRAVDYVVTGTQSLATLYAKTFGIGSDRVRVVPNDIRPERFESRAHQRAYHRAAEGYSGDDFVVLFVHRLAPRKGAQYILPIARGVREAVPRARFVIAGDGPMFEALRSDLRRDSGLTPYVRLLGSVPNKSVAAWFAAADAFFMPSEEEGFPRVLLECMAAGLPFVAADVGGVRDICDSTQMWSVVPPGDVPAFVERLIALERDGDRRRLLAAAGRVRVHSYTTDGVVEHTLQQLGFQARVVTSPAASSASLKT